MVKRRNDRPAGAALTFGEAADQIGDVLRGPARRDLLDRLEPDADPTGAFAGLRHAMRTHTLPGAAGPKSLRRVVDVLDARSRAEGLHVLHGWDFTAQRRPDDIAPVLLLDYCLRLGVPPGRARAMLAVLLDQYLLALLGVLVVRTWDDGDANANLDRVSALVADLQGSDGSGMQTVDDAESLVLLAVAYYHPEEPAYDNLLDRIRTLDDRHALRLALPCASVFGSHLRWGLRFMYRNDVGVMRDDNVVDYPWVLFALSTLMREYERIRGSGPSSARERIVCALVELLSPDPWAFAGPPPACLAAHAAEHAALRERLARYSPDLVVEFKALQPGAAYSPFGFQIGRAHV